MLQDINNSQIPVENQTAENQADSTVVQDDEDEISLIDLVAVLWKWKWFIIGVTLAGMIYIASYCMVAIKMDPEKSYMPNVYEVSATMLIQNDSNSGGLTQGASSTLANLLGVKVQTGSSTSSLILYLLNSNLFLDAVVDHFNLIEEKKIVTAPISTSREMVKNLVKAEYAGGTGVLTIKCENKDREYAYELVSFAIDWVANKLGELGVDNNQITKENLEKNIDSIWKKIQSLTYEANNLTTGIANGQQIWTQRTTLEKYRLEMELEAQKSAYTQLKSQLEILKINMQTETPTFQMLEAPIIPDKKTGPDRARLCMIFSAGAFFVSIFLSYLLNALIHIFKDPEIRRRLAGKKDNE